MFLALVVLEAPLENEVEIVQKLSRNKVEQS